MASILDRINKIGKISLNPQQRGIEEIIKAKGGKATGGAGPKSSTLGEQAAIGAGKQALKDQSIQSRLAGIQLGGQEQLQAQQQKLAEDKLRQQEQLKQEQLMSQASMTREGIQAGEEAARAKRTTSTDQNIKQLNNASEMKLRDLSAQRGLTLDNMFSQYEFDTAELEDRKDGAQLEGQAFLMGLQDKKYISEIDKIGKTRQLNLENQWNTELQSLLLGNNLNDLIDSMGFKKGQAVKGRLRQDELANINIDAAVELAQAVVKDNATRAKITAAGNIASTVGQDLASDDSTIGGLFDE